MDWRVAGRGAGAGNVVEGWAAGEGNGKARAFKPTCAVLRSSSAATRVLEEYGIVTKGSEYSNCEDDVRLSLSNRADAAEGEPGEADLE